MSESSYGNAKQQRAFRLRNLGVTGSVGLLFINFGPDSLIELVSPAQCRRDFGLTGAARKSMPF